MKLKKAWVLLVLPVVLALVLTGCSNDPVDDGQQGITPPPPTPTATPGDPVVTPPPAPARNLGGREIIVGNWWGNWCTETADPQTVGDEMRWLDRMYVQERYGFTIREVNLGGFGEIQELATMSIAAGAPAADIFILAPGWFNALNAQGMFHNLDALPSTNFSQAETGINWRHDVIDATRIGGNAHGWATEVHTGPGIFFNMRLFEEAGLDRYLPFDLQLRGEWTWDRFLEISAQLTRDIDGDGLPDTWALAFFSGAAVPMAVASNQAYFIGRDEQTGLFYNATNTPELFDAMSFLKSLAERGYKMPQPEGSPWYWADAAWFNANVAMYARALYFVGATNDNLADGWGWVTFPTGPNNPDGPRFMGNANVFCIPATFTAQEADDIMFAFSQWIRPIPGWDDPDAWKAAAYIAHYTPRSVDESIAMFARDPNRVRPAFHEWVDAPVHYNFVWPIFYLGIDVATQIEEGQLIILDAIARGNAN